MLPLRALPAATLAAIVATFGVIREAAATPEVEACLEAYDRGQAQRDSHKLREARKEFLSCAREVCPSAVKKDCTAWIEQVDKSLGSIVFRAVDAQGRDLLNAEIRIDGEIAATRIDGWAIVVEPGRHVVRASVPGHSPAEQTVVIGEGEKNRAVLFRVADPSLPESGARESRPRGIPASVWISGGVALAGLGTFAYAGITGTSDLGKLRDECGVTRWCSASEVDSVHTTLIVGDVAGAVGVAALGVLTYLLVEHFGSRSASRTAQPAATIVF